MLLSHHESALQCADHTPPSSPPHPNRPSELWHRASIAWKSILSESSGPTCLVVAHNAVNQALLCSAAGLPPSAFRKFTQGNGAVSVLDFAPAPLKGRSAEVTIDRVNQLPSLQVKKSDAKNATVVRSRTPSNPSAP